MKVADILSVAFKSLLAASLIDFLAVLNKQLSTFQA
jgi:hypothetical protein